ALGLPKSSTELLHEHDRRLSLSQQDDLVDRRDIHTFVEHIDRQDVVELTPLELHHYLLTTNDGVVPRQRYATQRAATERAPIQRECESMCFVLTTAIDQTPRPHTRLTIAGERIDEVIHSLRRDEE